MTKRKAVADAELGDLYRVPASTALLQCGGFHVLPVRLIGTVAEQQAREQLSLHEAAAAAEAAVGAEAAAASERRFHLLCFKALDEDDVAALPRALRECAAVGDVSRALLVGNVPAHYGRDELEDVFGFAGAVERIDFEPSAAAAADANDDDATPPPRHAVIQFRQARAVAACGAMSVEPQFAAAVASELQRGGSAVGAGDTPAAWASEYWALRPDVASWRAAIDRRVQAYDRRVELERRQRQRAATAVDADGFVVVQSGKKRQTVGGTSVSGATANSAAKARGRAGVASDFYTFQLAKRREREIAKLQTRFAADKERLARVECIVLVCWSIVRMLISFRCVCRDEKAFNERALNDERWRVSLVSLVRSRFSCSVRLRI
jgi:hypothetical protein